MTQNKIPILSHEVRIALEEMQSSITPDPLRAKQCREHTCNGKRGWYGVKIFEQEGKVVAQLMVCCGRIGGSDYDKILSAINRSDEKVADEMNRLHSHIDASGSTLRASQEEVIVRVGMLRNRVDAFFTRHWWQRREPKQ
jgi:hypothetical protein